ncbi:MAG: response regulator transcription factor [Gemmatimonadetes bacterium]|nr:response regulator transcription factor [Gemmatimonadota bacterium]
MLAEDHALVRAGVRALLSALDGIEVVAEAGDGREALRLAAATRPDVVIMDITMPDLNGLDATARIAKEVPHCRVLVLSMHAEEEYVAQALRCGAAGYLLKDSSNAELEVAVRAVARGQRYLSPGVSQPVIEEYMQQAVTSPRALDRLSPRQREVLQLIAEGHSTRAIARKLEISVKTVEAHRSQIMKRLAVRDVPALVRLAIRSGLVPLESYGPLAGSPSGLPAH